MGKDWICGNCSDRRDNVTPAFLSCGSGRRLLEIALEYCQTRNYERLTLSTAGIASQRIVYTNDDGPDNRGDTTGRTHRRMVAERVTRRNR